MLFSPEDHSETAADAHCLSALPLPRAFSEFITYQIVMENDENKHIGVERISILLARIYRKIENYFCISAEIWLLPDDLRHLITIHKPETRLSSCF